MIIKHENIMEENKFPFPINKNNKEDEKCPPLFIDQPQIGGMILDYPNYVRSISNFILSSHPQFTIGIFGDWGTGKTTMLLNIQNELERQECICVSFNPWRYENETAQITIPLILSVLTNLYEYFEKNKQDLLKKQTKENRNETLKNKIKRVFNGLSLNASFGIPGLAGLDIGYDFSQTNTENNNTAQEIPKTTLEKTKIQEGIDLIQELIIKTEGVKQNPKLKLIIFIDDLDRCSPENAVTIFESIKVFFDIEGIVFVLGLSNEIVELAINKKYEHFGGKFSGEDYLKKIIQLPIKIPQWQPKDIETYLEKSLLKNYSDSKLEHILKSNSKLISEAVEPNPREIKRFLNTFILTNQILMNSEMHSLETNERAKKLLAVQAIRLRWGWLYETVFDKTFRTNLEKSLQGGKNSKPKKLREGSILELVHQDENLKNFLKNSGKIIFSISDKEWDGYRRAGTIEHEIEANVEKPTDRISFGIQQKKSESQNRPFISAQIGLGGPFGRGKGVIEQAEAMRIQLKQERFLKQQETSPQKKKHHEGEIRKLEKEIRNFLYGFGDDYVDSFLK